MPTLFDIGDDFRALDRLIEELDGDISAAPVEQAVTEWYAELARDEGLKLEGYCRYIRQLEAEAAVARAEAAEYQAKARAREHRVVWLKAWMLQHLTATGRTRAETSTGRVIAVQANGGKVPVVFTDDSIDPAEVPDRLCRIKREVDVDAVRAALEAGEDLLAIGAWLGSRGHHLRIK